MFMRMQVWLNQRRRKLGRFLWMPNGFNRIRNRAKADGQRSVQDFEDRLAQQHAVGGGGVPQPFAFLSASRR